MLRRLAALERRHADAHLSVPGRGPALRAADGALVGYVDRILVTRGRLRVTGWALADAVTLRCGDRLVAARTRQRRADVAEALGVDADAVGFDLEIAGLPDLPGFRQRPAAGRVQAVPAGPDAGPDGAASAGRPGASGPALADAAAAPSRAPGRDEAMLILAGGAAGGVACILPLPRPALARLGVMLRFAWALLLALPALAGWAATGAARHRSRVKRRLGLHGLPEARLLDPRAMAGWPLRAGSPGTALRLPTDAPPDAAQAPRARGRRGPSGAAGRDRPITVILPVHDAFDLLPETLERLRRNTDLPWRAILIEDASTDPRVRPFLRDWTAAMNRAAPADMAAPGPAGGGPGAPGTGGTATGGAPLEGRAATGDAVQGDAGAAPRVTLIETATNLGFVGSVNLALRQAVARGAHVVLLNADAFVPPGWASRLLRPIEEDARVATVTPMSNDAQILSVPAACRARPLGPGQAEAVDAAARGFLSLPPVAIPTGVGFCMAMNAAFLRRLPRLDPAFGRGYGEEVDWCQRARALGGRHVAQPGLFVEHRGAGSFGAAARARLMARNNALIARRWPGFDAEVQGFLADDPLRTPRLALGLALAAAITPPAAPAAGGDGAGGTAPGTEPRARSGAARARVPVYLAHSLGGGAEDWLAQRIAGDHARGRAAVVLRVGGRCRWRVELRLPAPGLPGTGGAEGEPGAEMQEVAGETDDFGLVQRLLGALGPCALTYSCGVGDPDPVALPGHLLALRRPGDRVEVLFHDYFPVSPSYTLLDADGVYRGPVGPDRDGGRLGRVHRTQRPDGWTVGLSEWQRAWGALIGAADRVTVFSRDSAAQVLAVYPQAAERLALRPHRPLSGTERARPGDPAAALPAAAGHAGPAAATPAGPAPAVPMPAVLMPAGSVAASVGPARAQPAGRVVAVLGGINAAKGAAVLCELARRIGPRGEPRLVLIGSLDPAHAAPAHLLVHGRYDRAEIPALAARYGVTGWLIPSVWPETFSYTTHEALATGLPVHAFALGAQGEAVAAAPNGIAVPLTGDPVLALLQALALPEAGPSEDVPVAPAPGASPGRAALAEGPGPARPAPVRAGPPLPGPERAAALAPDALPGPEGAVPAKPAALGFGPVQGRPA